MGPLPTRGRGRATAAAGHRRAGVKKYKGKRVSHGRKKNKAHFPKGLEACSGRKLAFRRGRGVSSAKKVGARILREYGILLCLLREVPTKKLRRGLTQCLQLVTEFASTAPERGQKPRSGLRIGASPRSQTPCVDNGWPRVREDVDFTKPLFHSWRNTYAYFC